MIARTGSVAIKTDNVHYKSDLMLNGSVIVALVLEQALHIARRRRACSALLIALWLLWGAWRASREAVNQLMDREWPEEERQQFLAAAAAYPELQGLHDLRTRKSGTLRFVAVPRVGAGATGRCSKRTTGSTGSRRNCRSASPAPKS